MIRRSAFLGQLQFSPWGGPMSHQLTTESKRNNQLISWLVCTARCTSCICRESETSGQQSLFTTSLATLVGVVFVATLISMHSAARIVLCGALPLFLRVCVALQRQYWGTFGVCCST